MAAHLIKKLRWMFQELQMPFKLLQGAPMPVRWLSASERNIKCWGAGNVGQVGNGHSSATNSTPVTVVTTSDVSYTAIQVSTGTEHTCVVLSWQGGRCWGENDWGRLGVRNANNNYNRMGWPAIDDGWAREITAGSAHSCVILRDGRAMCWGDGNDGRIGNGNTSDSVDYETGQFVKTSSSNNADYNFWNLLASLLLCQIHCFWKF